MTDGYIECNSVSLYYQKYGSSGSPLIFLHGNGEDGSLFKAVAEKFSDRFSVYLLDSRSHGKSEKALLGYQPMAQDVRCFIENLRLEKPALYGFSDGGIIGLILAMNNPGLLSKFAVSGVNLNPKALKRGFRALVRFGYFFTRGKKLRLMLKEPDISPENLGRITEPVLVLAGEKDIVKKAHSAQIAAAVPDSRLKILEGENHSSYVENSGKLYDCLKDFFRE